MTHFSPETVSELICGDRIFKIGDHVEFIRHRDGRVLRGKISFFHASVHGDHRAQIEIGVNEKKQIVREIVLLDTKVKLLNQKSSSMDSSLSKDRQ